MSEKPRKPGEADSKTPPPRPAPGPAPSPRPASKTPVPRAPIEAIVASAPGIVFLLSREGRYQFTSRRVRSGSDPEAGRLLEQVHPPGQAAELRALMRRVESSGRPRSAELGSRDHFGRPCRLLLMLAPFLVDGRTDGFVGVALVTEAAETKATDTRSAELASRLTPKQREVLVLVAEGLSSREIADRLGVSERTVETHREQLMDRLDIHGVAALARFALAAGLL
jgi:RNA polymerase sigma factor (sigma-70 family)